MQGWAWWCSQISWGRQGWKEAAPPSPAPFARALGPGALVPNVRSLVQGRESGGGEGGHLAQRQH